MILTLREVQKKTTKIHTLRFPLQIQSLSNKVIKLRRTFSTMLLILCITKVVQPTSRKRCKKLTFLIRSRR